MANDTEAIFLAALEKSTPEGRLAYAEGACANDRELLEHVKQLLAAHEEAHGPLDSPPANAVAQDATVYHAIPEKPGTQIGPYKLLQELGRGGMGIVYMAEQSEPVSRRVALKIIKPGMDTGQVIARFEVERQALAMMDHPNIAKVLDAGATDSGRPYFVMEMVKGIPITQYCDEQHLSPKERIELFVEVCQAVQHAHQKGIIHRDIKPTNVLVAEYDQQAVPKIIDFGVAKATSQKLTEKTMFTQFGQIMGTLEYMSPEQAKLNQLDIDTRSDVYSLGVLLYELLTGDTPFDRKRLHSAAFEEMLRIIREEEPPKPSTRLSGSNDRLAIAKRRAQTPDRLDKLVKGDLDWIAMKSLEKDRARRYQTASSLAADIERFLGNEAIEARPPSRIYRARKFVRRNKGPVAAAAALLVVLVAGICTTGAALVVARRERDRAETEADRANANERLARQEAESAKQANERVLQIFMQDALAFGLSGDTERTTDFIQRAKVVGASEAQVELMRLTLANGLAMDTEWDGESVQRAQRLIELDPDNIPARVMLAAIHFERGNLPEFVRHAEEAASLEPRSPEDYIFLANQSWFLDPEKAVQLLDQALAQHESAFARVMYAFTLCELALRNNDRNILDKALAQARSAQVALGGARIATIVQLRCLDHAHYLARKDGDADTVLTSLAAEGDMAAEKILDAPRIMSHFLWDCAAHYDYVKGDKQRAESAWQRAIEAGLAMTWRTYYAAFKLKHEGPESALLVHNGERGEGHAAPAQDLSVLLLTKSILLALCDRRAEATVALSDLERSEGLQIVMPAAAVIPLLLGDQERARRMLRQHAGLGPSFLRPDRPPVDKMAGYLMDELSAEELLHSVSGPKQLSCTYHIMALKALADRDWQTARDYFTKSVDVVWPFHVWHHPWSAAYLEHMERDPHWPVGRSELAAPVNHRE